MARAVGDLLAEFDAQLEQESAVPPSWNIAPTAEVPILLERLVDGGVKRQLHVARWGLVPSWAKDPGIGTKMFNARSESVLEKQAFREPARSRRCAVPADGYYEWKKDGGSARQPYYVHSGDDGGMVFAGLYDWWKDQSKAVGEPGRWLLSVSILTADSPSGDSPSADSPGDGAEASVLGELASLHDRIPLPMNTETMEAWLDPRADDAAALVHLVRTKARGVTRGWRIVPVSSRVGNVRNDSPELIQPVEIMDALF